MSGSVSGGIRTVSRSEATLGLVRYSLKIRQSSLQMSRVRRREVLRAITLTQPYALVSGSAGTPWSRSLAARTLRIDSPLSSIR